MNVSSAYPVVPEDPPRPQPDAPLAPGEPRVRSVDSLWYRPSDTAAFTLATTGTDRIDVTGLAILDGTLTIALAEGFVPVAGDEITLLTYGSVRGHFAAGRGLYGQSGDLWFDVVQTGDETTAGSLKLVVSRFLPGLNAAISLADALGVDSAAGFFGKIGRAHV